MEILWKSTVFTQFQTNRPKLYGNCAFPQNFHTRKLGEITAFYAVDVNDFPFRNKDKWRQEVQKPKDCYYKFVRRDQLIMLYKEYLEDAPIYISRKFRNDDIYTINHNEKNIYFKFDLVKFKTLMEVLTTRKEHFRNKLDRIDKEMTDFINNKATSELVAEKIKEMWVKDSVTNNTRIEEVWKKNINGK